jgi:predicted amidophosphoribosyltransferase
MVSYGQFSKHLGAWLGIASDALVSVVSPAGCRLCEQLLTRASRVPICDECLSSFAVLPPEVCEICGSPVVTPFAVPDSDQRGSEAILADADYREPRGCIGCQGRTYAFERARSYAAYEGRLIRAIVILRTDRATGGARRGSRRSQSLMTWVPTSWFRCRSTVKESASAVTTRPTSSRGLWQGGWGFPTVPSC